MLQPFSVADAVLQQYNRYVRTGFPLRDSDLADERDRLIAEENLLWSNPFVSLSRPGVTGPALADLGSQLLPETLGLPWGFEHLYEHQALAIDRLRASRPGGPASTLVLSGTGSGKTESFLIPIVDACLRRKDEPGVKAVIIYPMNALANDQLDRLTGLLAGTDITFGRYTGDAPESDAGSARQPPRPADAPENLLWSREAMRLDPPDILITNYLQLELLLLRGRDRELFANGAPSYLVVDEIHLFAGVLGAEVAALLRRFRQHLGLRPDELTVVGTSATSGSAEQRAELLSFAHRFFGVPLDDEALVEEQPAPSPEAGPHTPASVEVTSELLAAADSDEGLIDLAEVALGVDLSGHTGEELGRKLGESIDQFKTISVVEEALRQPAPLEAAAAALLELPERQGAEIQAVAREAEALVLLGSAAIQESVGEPDGAPRLRPRVHQIVRSLAGLARCLGCRRLLPPGSTRCADCESRALPLAACRSCGAAFWACGTSQPLIMDPVEPGPNEGRRFVAAEEDAVEFDDEDGRRHEWTEIVFCEGCGAWTEDAQPLIHATDCPTPSSNGRMAKSSEDGSFCPACAATGTGGRDVLTPQRGAGAASVAVITQTLGDQLRARHNERDARLLVFADSRQDAGQQAGYADDQGTRVTVRQHMVKAIRQATDGPISLPELTRSVKAQIRDDEATLRRWLIGESQEHFAERSEPNYMPSEEDRRSLLHQIEWELTLELTERARRRYSLELNGLISVEVEDLPEVAARVAEHWPEHPFGSTEGLERVILAVVDAMRFSRAVDTQLLKLKPMSLRTNQGVRIGDRAVSATRGFAERPRNSRRDELDIKRWHSENGDTRIARLVGRVMGTSARDATTRDSVDRLVEELRQAGVLVNSRVDGRNRTMVDHKRLILCEPQTLFRCPRCGHVRAGQLLTLDGDPLCLGHTCKGQPESWTPPAERDFYRNQYQEDPRRLIVREHSGQIETDVRLALEQAFNNPDSVSVDVLACTPTLEVGVSLDDLNAVILRNLPPTPANYAQRVGRAGRRSKVALTLAHAGNAPHDAYFFGRPGELIAGAVEAPAISLDNDPLIERHLNSLVMETLGTDLPGLWMPPREGGMVEETICDDEGVVREAVIDGFRDALGDVATRRKVEEAVRGAFASSQDPAPPTGIDELCDRRIENFSEDLRLALKRWSDRYRAVESECLELRGRRRLTEEQRRERNRLEVELERMEVPNSPEQNPLGFLGLVGFLPRYGATGERALLSVPMSDAPIDQAAHVAVTEYAPGNLVYARGRRLKVTKLHPKPVDDIEEGAEFRDNVIKEGRHCESCGTFTTDPMVRACPTCEEDLATQVALRMTGVRGSGAAISSDDEYRSRNAYDVRHHLGAAPEPDTELDAAGLRFRLTRRREITIANRGLRGGQEDQPIGFSVCRECGFTEEDPGYFEGEEDPEVENRGHSSRCPGRTDPDSEVIMRNVWMIADLRGDVLELPLAPGQDAPAMLEWRRTLPEALMLGIRETMQAGRRDLDSFEVSPQGIATKLVIFDTMPGGTGYLTSLLADDASGLRKAAEDALERLEICDCETSCHRCLRDFWNQRDHGLLNRHAVIPTLRRLSVADPTTLEPEPDEQLASFLEQEFFERLKEAELPEPSLQGIHRLPDGRITVADAVYADPDISIYLDGRAYHAQSLEKIQSDLRKRNMLEEEGRLVLEFTYTDVMSHFDKVVEVLSAALAGVPEERGTPSEVLSIAGTDEESGVLEVEVDAESWVNDESSRQRDLAAANATRLAGWRLRRTE